MQPYDPAMAATMKRLYDSLNEKDRRRYAGIEALKLGFGGRRYIAGVLGCSRRTVSKGARSQWSVYPKSGSAHSATGWGTQGLSNPVARIDGTVSGRVV